VVGCSHASVRPATRDLFFRLGALRLSVTDTLLIFVAVPLAVVVVIAALGYVGNRGGSGDKRYRPGRHFDFAPVWFVNHPEQLVESGRAEITEGERKPAVTTGNLEVAGAVAPAGETGGASDRW